MGRKLRSRLDLIVPSMTNIVGKKQWTQKWSHDKKARRREFVVGDGVFVRNYGRNETWIASLISEVTDPVSFSVVLVTGQIVHKRGSGYVQSDGCVGMFKREYA